MSPSQDVALDPCDSKAMLVPWTIFCHVLFAQGSHMGGAEVTQRGSPCFLLQPETTWSLWHMSSARLVLSWSQ